MTDRLQHHTVLVVGGAGYIGSHTVLALKDAGFRTVVYDNFSTGQKDAVFSDHLVEGELADTALLIDTMTLFNVGSVVHFAALIEAGESVRDPLRFYRNNVAASVSLLEAMVAANVRRLVFSSTAAVYGNRNSDDLLHEDLAIAPENPYGTTKAVVEGLLRDLAAAGAIQAIALRYFNAAGADPDGRCGERHDPETHLIPLVLQAALGQREDIAVFGSDYPTKDGTCVRDYVHVSDLASGHIAALHKLLEMPSGEGFFRPFNLGTGTGYSVREVIDSARRITGQHIPATLAERRPGDPARLVANADRAHAELNWRPTHSSLTSVISDAWEFLQSRGE